MEHRRREYAAEMRATAAAVVPAVSHPLQLAVTAAVEEDGPATASAPKLAAPVAQAAPAKSAPAPVQFDDPLQAALQAEDDPLGAFSKGEGRTVVDSMPIGLSAKSESSAPQSASHIH